MPSPREWLQQLEQRDEHVRGYMNLHRSRVYLRSGTLPADDLAPEVLVGCIEVLVAAHYQTQRAFNHFARRHFAPPVLLIDKMPGDVGLQMEAGGVNIISADEWPKTERSLVEHSNVIYFMDFLRSFWGRLTKRLLP